MRSKRVIALRLFVALFLVVPLLPFAAVHKMFTKDNPQWFTNWIDYLADNLPE